MARWSSLLAAVAAAGAFGCGPSPIIPPRIEAAIETTFANLVALQDSRLGLPPMRARDAAVRAICRRSFGGDSGAGEWTCTLVWQGPDHRTRRNTYDLIVNTDGCYTAISTGEKLGGPILTAPDGRSVKNLLYAFDGCFDTT
jgi:hypothetical protein